MGSVRREAERLRAIQGALDLHKAGCGDPVRAILLSPFDYAELDWDDFSGVPIEVDRSLNPDVVRIDCLRTTVQAAIEEFHEALKGSDEALKDAEARLEAKIEQIAAAKEDWWRVTREPEWWKRLARRDPEVYSRFIQGKVSWQDRVRAEAAQFPEEKPPVEQTPELNLAAWLDAWQDFEDELRSTEPNPDRVTSRSDLPKWLLDDLQGKALRFYDQEKERSDQGKRAPGGRLRRLFGLVMRKRSR